MPYCTNCGAESSGKFCPECGAPISTSQRTSSASSDTPNGERSKYGTSGYTKDPYGGERSQYGATPGYTGKPNGERSKTDTAKKPYGTPSQKQSRSSANPKNYKLGWHKFLIYFWIWVAALGSIVDGIRCFQWTQDLPLYGLIGLAEIAYGVFLIYVRFQLAKFKKDAPKKLIVSNGISCGIDLIVVIYIASLGGDVSTAVSSMMLSLALVGLNWRYYSPREELFVN